MKKAITTKKKIIIILAAIIVLALCAAAGYKLWLQYIEERTFSYEVYDDHVELVRYTGNAKFVVVPDELEGKPVTVLRSKFCANNTTIQKVYLGRNIKEIGEYAFFSCSYLEQVTGKAEVEVISGQAFSHCERLTRLEAGNSIKKIDYGAFYRCRQLNFIGEQPELEYIGLQAFYYSGTLGGLEVPEHTQVDRDAFECSLWHCEREFVVFRGELLSYNGPETGEAKRREATAEVAEVPYGVKKIGSQVFGFHTAGIVFRLEEVRLPETVEEIELYAFAEGHNFRIYMPDSVTTIRTESRTSWTIVTTSGSYAEEYAKEHGIDYEIVEPW